MASSLWTRASTLCGRTYVPATSRQGFSTVSASYRVINTIHPSYSRQNSSYAAKVASETRSRSRDQLSTQDFPAGGKEDIERLRPDFKEPEVILDSGVPIQPFDMPKASTVDRGPEFSTLQGRVSNETLKAITIKPHTLTHMSPVQAEVLPLLPEIAEPYSEHPPADGKARPPRDLLVKARTGTGKTLAFLVPAIEARLKAIDAFGKQAVKDAGLTSDKHMESRARRVFSREQVGTLIISPTRELATQIANEALRLTHHHKDFEVRLFVGGSSKRMQMRDWMKGRRDIVVSTPGRLRDLLTSEPEIVRGISKTKLFILDEADTLLDMGFRDDIQAITDFLPKTPERQTFLFSATVSRQIQQVARATMDKNHIFINTVSDNASPVHAHVPQYHTVLPSASEQIPHTLRLLAHDQLINPGRSKTIVFLPTTKMTQLFTTIVRELSKTVLPAKNKTKVYEIHSKRTQEARTMASDAFRADKSGSSILVTSDVSARGVDYPGVTRVIQVGIPAGSEQYIHRVGRTGRAGTTGRGDLVLLPWECGFLTWQLNDVPLKPLTITELKSQITQLSEKYDQDPSAAFKGVDISVAGPRYDRNGRSTTNGPSLYNPPVSTALADIPSAISKLLDNVDEEAVRETFASLLGYYIAKSHELRVQKGVIVQGCKDWATDACGLPTPPYVSEAFLHKLGFTDGRTKRFGSQIPRSSNSSSSQPSWMGRGMQRNKGREEVPAWANTNIDDTNPHDPRGAPEEYRSQRYGRPSGYKSDDGSSRPQRYGSDDARPSRGGLGGGQKERYGQRDAGGNGYGMRR